MNDAILEEAAAVLASGGVDASEVRVLAELAGPDGQRLMSLARARASGAPLGQLTGRHSFLGVDLLTAPGVLVPRPETEVLARRAIEVLRSAASEGREVHFLDLCCGSGNLACAIATHVPTARGWASDLTDSAVALSRRNVDRLGLSARVQVMQGDLLEPFAKLRVDRPLDALVCNPPYISTSRLERDRAGLLLHEPREAFDGGPYGLTIHQRVAREAPQYLRPGVPLLIEIGEGQERQLVLVLKRAGAWEEPEMLPDGDGVVRAVMARRKAG